jgi:arabinofuranosyltransferase
LEIRHSLRGWFTGRTAAALVLSVLLALLALVVARTAWVGDDAYITFRTIDNALHGYGLRWNVAERVQAYTHPLWLFVLLPIVAVTGNPYLSVLGVSALLTGCTVALLLAGTRDPWQRITLVVAMVLSKAFTDYSTSGLENSLSHVLLAALMRLTDTHVVSRRRALGAGTLVALVGLARIDLLLLSLPIALSAVRGWRRTVPALLLGLAPLAVWEIFSVVYYGVPFPNTAYAKLATGVPHHDLAIQGLSYVFNSLGRDPVTLFVIGCAIVAGGLAPARDRVRAGALLLYLAYVVRIGGDFMSGRFFTAPFVVGLGLLRRVSWPAEIPSRVAVIGAVAALGLTVPIPTIFSGSNYEMPWTDMLSDTGIVDERGFYFPHTAWWAKGFFRTVPQDQETLAPRIARAKAMNPRAFPHGAVGMVGYYTGPDRQIVDTFALCDPLLARLPAKVPWRIGHFERELPEGYLESVAGDRNVIRDPAIASLYETIRVVTRGPLWSVRRWKAILSLNRWRTPGQAAAP